MILHESVENSVGSKGDRGKTHSTEFIVPISEFFGGELDACVLDVIKTGRNVLNFYFFCLLRAEFDEIGLEGKLFWVSVDDLHYSF